MNSSIDKRDQHWCTSPADKGASRMANRRIPPATTDTDGKHYLRRSVCRVQVYSQIPISQPSCCGIVSKDLLCLCSTLQTRINVRRPSARPQALAIHQCMRTSSKNAQECKTSFIADSTAQNHQISSRGVSLGSRTTSCKTQTHHIRNNNICQSSHPGHAALQNAPAPNNAQTQLSRHMPKHRHTISCKVSLVT
jgi:hypothetical protein